MPRQPDSVVALPTAVRAATTVAPVSNATSRLESDLERLGPGGLADVVVNTSRVGVAKPDPRLYAIAAELVGADPSACPFIDGTEANVVAARRAGMTAVHCRRFPDLREVLAPPGGTAPNG